MASESEFPRETSGFLEKSPEIVDASWGRLVIKGRNEPFKDAKLFPGGAAEWDWRTTGTSHGRGIQPAAVEELLSHGATVIVLAIGYDGRLKVARKTLKLLETAGIPFHVAKTEEAINIYNNLRTHTSVAGLFHTTC